MLHFFLVALRAVRADLALVRRSRMLRLAVLGVSIVPAIYALIYLSSVWDPNAKTSALPVALVNLDTGIHYQGHDINVGSQLGTVLIGTKMRRSRAYSAINWPSLAWMRVITGGEYLARLS